MPVDRVVHSDELEAVLWLKVIERAAALRQDMIKHQAQHIAAEVSKLF